MTTTQPPEQVASPCVRNCCLDEQNICMGCGRSLDEIVRWGTAPAAEKQAILTRSRERALQRRSKFEGNERDASS